MTFLGMSCIHIVIKSINCLQLFAGSIAEGNQAGKKRGWSLPFAPPRPRSRLIHQQRCESPTKATAEPKLESTSAEALETSQGEKDLVGRCPIICVMSLVLVKFACKSIKWWNSQDFYSCNADSRSKGAIRFCGSAFKKLYLGLRC